MTRSMSEDAAQSLLQLINESMVDSDGCEPDLPFDDTEPVAGAIPRDFCGLWPEVRSTLYRIGTASTGLGGLVHTLGIAGQVLVAAGDAPFKIACRPEPRA